VERAIRVSSQKFMSNKRKSPVGELYKQTENLVEDQEQRALLALDRVPSTPKTLDIRVRASYRQLMESAAAEEIKARQEKEKQANMLRAYITRVVVCLTIVLAVAGLVIVILVGLRKMYLPEKAVIAIITGVVTLLMRMLQIIAKKIFE